MDESQQIYVEKTNGEFVPYDREKLLTALKNAGALTEQLNDIVPKVERQLYDGIKTARIYQLAYRLLRKKSHRSAGRYRLKNAIFELGPSGYPFEIFVGKLFESFGYSVEIGVKMQGKCIGHEVDVVAKKTGEQIIVECKFHSDRRGKTNVQVPLYIQSRFNDIEAKWKEKQNDPNTSFRGYVVTNTRFTKDAIEYAECTKLGMISWDYPVDGSLKHYIDLSGLHPVTSLHALNKTHKKNLLDEGIVLCSELVRNTGIMEKYGFDEKLIKKVIDEAKNLIGH